MRGKEASGTSKRKKVFQREFSPQGVTCHSFIVGDDMGSPLDWGGLTNCSMVLFNNSGNEETQAAMEEMRPLRANEVDLINYCSI